MILVVPVTYNNMNKFIIAGKLTDTIESILHKSIATQFYKSIPHFVKSSLTKSELVKHEIYQ